MNPDLASLLMHVDHGPLITLKDWSNAILGKGMRGRLRETGLGELTLYVPIWDVRRMRRAMTPRIPAAMVLVVRPLSLVDHLLLKGVVFQPGLSGTLFAWSDAPMSARAQADRVNQDRQTFHWWRRLWHWIYRP